LDQFKNVSNCCLNNISLSLTWVPFELKGGIHIWCL
jgi:hypothetical protein